jgi:hypothetical protein
MPRSRVLKGHEVPQPFRVRFDPVREAWAVLQGERWRFAKEVCVQVAVLSINDQLAGVGVVRTTQRGSIVVTA